MFPSATSSQTIGPFFRIGLDWPNGRHLVNEATKGDRIVLSGLLLDVDGLPVTDGMIEIWQADHEGRYYHPEDRWKGGASVPDFLGFGRCETDEAGRFEFQTIKPGVVPGPDGTDQAPHINVAIFARGLLVRLFTRLYFENEDSNLVDPVLNLVPESRRSTLIARLGALPNGYTWEVILGGETETVFFDC